MSSGREMGFMDKTFANTNVVVLVLFAICCSGIALIFGIIGLVTCTDEKAKSNAKLTTIIAAIVTVSRHHPERRERAFVGHDGARELTPGNGRRTIPPRRGKAAPATQSEWRAVARSSRSPDPIGGGQRVVAGNLRFNLVLRA